MSFINLTPEYNLFEDYEQNELVTSVINYFSKNQVVIVKIHKIALKK